MTESEFEIFNREPVMLIAHRGGVCDGPETNLKVCKTSVELDKSIILEIGVRATEEGEVCVLHGPSEYYETIHPSKPLTAREADGKLRLDELFSNLPPTTRLFIDPKHGHVTEATAQIIVAHEAMDRVAISSLRQSRTDATARSVYALSGRKIATITDVRAAVSLIMHSRLRPQMPWNTEHPAVQLWPNRITERLMEVARKSGIKVISWTVAKPDEIHRLLSIGVDGIMTNYPSALKLTLQRHGLWAPDQYQ